MSILKIQIGRKEIKHNKNLILVVKPAHLVALNALDESLTWHLEGLDPKIRIDKNQVACWDDMTDNVLVDLPCCKVLERKLLNTNQLYEFC